MKYLLLDKEKIKEKLEKVKNEQPLSIEIVFLKQLLNHPGEDLNSLLKDAFEAGRKGEHIFNEYYQTVDSEYEFVDFLSYINHNLK